MSISLPSNNFTFACTVTPNDSIKDLTADSLREPVLKPPHFLQQVPVFVIRHLMVSVGAESQVLQVVQTKCKI